MAAPELAPLANLLGQTLSPAQDAVKAATEQLKGAETTPRFGVLLLQLVGSEAGLEVRQAGSIYLKNFLKRNWDIAPEQGGVSNDDRNVIKTHLLSLMLQAPRPIQVQLGASIAKISESDFPNDWQNLLPELVERLKANDLAIMKGSMDTAHTVFEKYRSQARSEDLLREIKYVVEKFQEVHLTVFKGCVQQLATGVQDPQLKTLVEILLSTLKVFYSLNVVDLPEYYEDHMQEWFQGFQMLLKYSNPALDSGDDSSPGILEEVRGQVCENMALYADKYQEEFEAYCKTCVKDVWELLISLGQKEKNDGVAASGIKFLSSASGTRWKDSPFDDPQALTAICEKVIIPNIFLRESDVELFDDNPQEYIRRDIENADQDTRRRSAIDFVKALSKFYDANVTAILTQYVERLLQEASANQSWHTKDACVYLVIAMVVRGETRLKGVSITNDKVDVMGFLASQVVPVLTGQSPHNCLTASCLKFVTTFRNQIPPATLTPLLGAIVPKLGSDSAVIHTYAAHFLEKMLLIKDATPQGPVPRYVTPSTSPQLLQAVEPLLQQIVSNKGIPQNEYLMKCLLRIFGALGEQSRTVAVQTLKMLASVLQAVSANPSSPLFNHYLFEAIATIMKVAVVQDCAQVEQSLIPVCNFILANQVSDFMPYTFQILALMLESTSSVQEIYKQIFSGIMTAELWRATANVPGLIRLLSAYFARHSVMRELLVSNLEGILQRFQFVLSHRRLESYAFDLLSALFRLVPVDLYEPRFKDLVQVLLTKIHQKKTPKLMKDFSLTLSVFVHASQDHRLCTTFSSIQPGLVTNVLQHIWFPSVGALKAISEKKIAGLAVARLLSYPEVAQNPALFQLGCETLTALLSVGGADTGDDDDDEPDEMAQEYEVAFAKLNSTDTAASRFPDVGDVQSGVKQLLLPQAAAVQQVAAMNPKLQPLAQLMA
jgi:exportin-2 (importin alpha re-exporter)